MFSASLTWTASSDPNVTGYNIYYGGASGQYTNVVPVGAVTNAVVTGLTDATTYYFAAKARNAAGDESPFSNEAIFSGFTVTPGNFVQQPTIPTNSSGDQLTFSLTGAVPPGATINPTNGIFAWCPSLGCASSTNTVTVAITDDTNPSLSTTATLLIVVTDYLVAGLGSTAVQSGQPGVLPITVSASDALTNLQIAVTWPAGQLTIPTLTFAPPVTAGSVQMQGATAVVDLAITPGQSLATSSTIAQLNFSAQPGQRSAFINIQATGVSSIKSDGSAYNNAQVQGGQVVVVGSQPLLQLQASPGQGNTLTLFGNPGANYQVQYATSLTPPVAWIPLQNHLQAAIGESLNLDNSQPTVYYRLQEF